MFNKFEFLFLAIVCLHFTEASIPVVDINVSDPLYMKHGIGWPYVLQLMEGQDALIHLASVPNDELDSCYITSPLGVKFDTNFPSNDKFEKWGEGCGVRIKKVVQKDEGRWRLTATKGNRTFIGWSQVHVYVDWSQYRGPDITLEDGQPGTVHLSTLANSYCYVEQPFSEGSLVAGHCGVKLDRATKAVEGNWNVFLGIPGRVQELHIERHVKVESERLDVGYIHDRAANKLHLYCNLMHSEKNITFCRFQKVSSSSGFNVLDGLSDGSHSYYGEGLLKKQCGMTIEHPTNDDYGTWRCSVGNRKWVGAHLEEQQPLQALISTTNGVNTRINRLVTYDNEDTTSIFVQENEQFTLNCRGETSLRYCWFQHPNGSTFTPVTLDVNENHEFWYSGESLQSGDCGITFAKATENDTGEWVCHMGPRDTLGIEMTTKLNVKVTGALAANRKNIATNIGDVVHLFCHTSNGIRALEYCRFSSPNFLGINIDSSVTEENAIDGHYYFTPGRSLNRGDCSLTIKGVRPQDIGTWICAGLIDNTRMEARDDIHLEYDVSWTRKPLSQASIVGMSVGISILVITLFGFLVYKKFGLPPWRPTPQSQRDIMSLSDITSRASNGSGSSQDSDTIVQNNNAQSDNRSLNSFNSDTTHGNAAPNLINVL